MLLFLAVKLSICNHHRLLSRRVGLSIRIGVLGCYSRLQLVFIHNLRLCVDPLVLAIFPMLAHLIRSDVILGNTAVVVVTWLATLAQSRRYGSH